VKTLTWMLTRMVMMRFLAIALGISIFVITLDVFTYVDDILELHNDDLSALGEYALLRFPGVLSTFLPMSVLLALLLTLVEMSYRSETTALWATGTSPVKVMIMLLPLGALLGGVNFLVNDQAVPRAAPTLHAWGIGDYGKKQLSIGEKDPIWMRAGNDILRAADSNAQSTLLEDVVIFRRDANGLLLEQVMAEKAQMVQGRWELSNAVIYYRENILPNRVDKLIYSGSMRPAAAGARSGDPEEMSLSDLDYFIINSGFGIRPAHVYETWWHKRVSLLASAFLMIALCVPLAVRFRRGGGISMLFGIGVALGFAFFIFDGISLTIGELGIVPAWMAAWAPVLVFAGLAATLTLRAETVT
jgi:lipopolysaccharide export system permease protein